MTEPDTTEKVETTETGYRMTIKSKRGTGTRDQDEVSITAKTETLEKLQEQRTVIRTAVITEMKQQRMHKPDKELSEETGESDS
jgi:hypothetical protein